jgi:hypothetical protein
LIVAIKKLLAAKVAPPEAAVPARRAGAADAEPPNEVTMPVFSYFPNDGLAELIVEAWTKDQLKSTLLERDERGSPTERAVRTATAKVNEMGGFKLQRAVVISEAEHDADYVMREPNEVVFVLPDDSRVIRDATGLLQTAKLLMACTPNGI